MKIYEYEIELSDDMDRDYHREGIVIAENEDKAGKQVYDYYDKRTSDYVDHNVVLKELDIGSGKVIEYD